MSSDPKASEILISIVRKKSVASLSGISFQPVIFTPTGWKPIPPRFRRMLSFKTLLATIVLFSVGCDTKTTTFEANRLLTARMQAELQVDLSSIENQVQSALTDLFGTPDHPHWPDSIESSSDFKSMVESGSLDRAAGPVNRDNRLVERGLFRKHCAQCHGIAGDGLGPAAALLNPYPRDFRRGSFKFKSTPQGAKPVLSDLVRTIEIGIPGTSMPAMANLVQDSHYDNDIPILANYVQFLAMRGEVERRLMMELVRDVDVDAGETVYDVSLKEKDPSKFAAQASKIDEIVAKVARSWVTTKVSQASEDHLPRLKVSHSLEGTNREIFLESAIRGRKLFQSETAACWQCHGKDGSGKGKLVDFDEWTKDWTIRSGIDPKDPKQWKPLKKFGLLKPIPVSARNLHLGVFRGGNSPDAIFRTIVHGIEGTPMPAAALQPSVKNGLTEDQVWDLVHFCQSLGIADLCESMEANHSGT